MSLLMSIMAGMGGGGITLNLNDHDIGDTESVPTSASASVAFQEDGQIAYAGNASDTPNPDTDEWAIEQPLSVADATLYEVAHTVLVSGTAPVGAALGVYEDLSTQRIWSLGNSVSDAGVWRFRVREIADTSNFAETDVTCTLTVNP